MTATLEQNRTTWFESFRSLLPQLVVAALVVGLGASWLIARNGDQTDFESDVVQLVEDYLRAWDAGDGDAVVALMTDDGVHTCPLGTFAVDDDNAAGLIRAVERMGVDDFVLLSDAIVAGPEAPTEVSVYLSINGPYSETPGLAQYTVVEQDGELRIARSIFTHL